jgi:hypothetical protein
MTAESLAEKSARKNRVLGMRHRDPDQRIARMKPGEAAGGKRLMVG